MSILISATSSDPSAFFPSTPVQTPTTVTPAPQTHAQDQVEDTVTLSQTSKVSQLNLQGATPTQIAEKLGISLANVDLDLGLVTAESVPATSAAPVAKAAPASTPASSTPAPTPAPTTPDATAPASIKAASSTPPVASTEDAATTVVVAAAPAVAAQSATV
jgi:hypothetical protein